MRGGVFRSSPPTPKSHIKSSPGDVTYRMLKTIPGDIFGTGDVRLNFLENLSTSHQFTLKYYHRHNQMLQFLCAYGSVNKKYK